MPANPSPLAVPGSAALTVAGAGAIGSFLVAHLARIPSVGRITLVDPDVYEEKNVTGQDITLADVGRPKVAVQRKRLLRINPNLDVFAIADFAQNVPPGRLKADVILSALDSRRARLEVGRLAWGLGVGFLDAGVNPAGTLARVNLYVPSDDAACAACAMSATDYAALEQVYPCRNGSPVAPTNAPSSLGALAAALLAIECAKLLSGEVDRSLAGRQLIIDAAHHKHYVTTFRRNPECRFDHRVWDLRPAPRASELTLADIVALADLGAKVRLRFIGHTVVHRVVCSACGRLQKELSLSGRSRRRRCSCGEILRASGFHMTDTLDCARAAIDLSRRLDRLGCRDGDVVAVENDDRVRHFLLGG